MGKNGVRALAAISVLIVSADPARTAEDPVVIPSAVIDEKPAEAATAVAVLAGGCFWGVQAVFQHVDGVLGAVSGYAGGPEHLATYEAVGRGNTGHAESVRITYDPNRVTYGQLLHVYFSVAHDPTQLDRQGPDLGPQYRSAIFPMNDEQHRIAEAYIAQLDNAHVYSGSIVTTIEDDKAFFPAETYHQDYLVRNPTVPYIVINDMPKVEALREIFPELWRDEPVLVLPAPRLAAPR